MEINKLDEEIASLSKQKQSQQMSKETLIEETNELKVQLASKA